MTRVDQNTIVVGIDASEGSERALDWAIAEAARSQRSLLLLNAWHWSSSAVASPMALVGQPDPFHSGRQMLERARERAKRHGVTASTCLVEGAAASALTEASSGAGMLVVGAHSHGALAKTLAGSVSRACIQHAQCPVVVVPAASPHKGVVAPEGDARPLGAAVL
jgi:nucleotide-binding universal stress UspA family protein